MTVPGEQPTARSGHEWARQESSDLNKSLEPRAEHLASEGPSAISISVPSHGTDIRRR